METQKYRICDHNDRNYGDGENIKMEKEEHLIKLQQASSTGDPLRMAVATYQAFRESPQAEELKESTKKGYDECALKAIGSMAKILEELGWEDNKVEEFLIKSKELAGIE